MALSIKVSYRSCDGSKTTRTFKSLAGAQKFAHNYVGEHPEIGRGYAVSGDGIGQVSVDGITLQELFPARVEEAPVVVQEAVEAPAGEAVPAEGPHGEVVASEEPGYVADPSAGNAEDMTSDDEAPRAHKPVALKAVHNADGSISVFASRKLVTRFESGKGLSPSESLTNFVIGWFGDHEPHVRHKFRTAKAAK